MAATAVGAATPAAGAVGAANDGGVGASTFSSPAGGSTAQGQGLGPLSSIQSQSTTTPAECTPTTTATTTVQMQNVCLAKAVLDHLHIESSGMKDFYWPCRMETFLVPVDYTGTNNNDINEGNAELRKQLQQLYGSPGVPSTSSSSSSSSSSSYQPTTTVVLDGCHNEHR